MTMKKIRLIILLGVLGAAISCTGSTPIYYNRAEAIAAEIRNPESRYVAVASHRGDWRNFPENSIPAIESVIRMGVDIVEIDLKLTKDSILVLSHDTDVIRCTNFRSVFGDEPGKSPKVKDLTYEEIRRLGLRRAHGATIDTLRMPTLREALECCKDRICVNIDKGYDYYDLVISLTEELGVTDQIIIKSSKSIEEVAENESRHAHNTMYMPVVAISNGKGKALLDSYLESGTVPPAYEICWNKPEDDFKGAVEKILTQGSKVWVNTLWGSLCGGNGNDDDAAYMVEDPGTVYAQYLKAGVSIIQTDRPELLVSWLERQGRHTLSDPENID